ncbi:DUF6232 family protein [Chryseolinea sp. H1M3-3]|uniref:DUF6232 family protein n=1 Tax=Chryseolinea sp. H1M3-3 TaxID=3034144 RepID=UPI0023EC1DF9|nr:DUF6232 family protein [Chryseolinea sp. H1M3-3]
MIPDKVLYTDGRGVTVTDSTFQVNKTSYRLNGIVKHGLFIMRPERLPGMLLLIVGFIVAVVGILNLIPPSFIPNMQIDNEYVSANTVAMWAGGSVALIGLLILAVLRERYAVRIATAEGEKNAIVSDKKEYISQIVNALNEAFSHSHLHTEQDLMRNQI